MVYTVVWIFKQLEKNRQVKYQNTMKCFFRTPICFSLHFVQSPGTGVRLLFKNDTVACIQPDGSTDNQHVHEASQSARLNGRLCLMSHLEHGSFLRVVHKASFPPGFNPSMYAVGAAAPCYHWLEPVKKAYTEGKRNRVSEENRLGINQICWV